MKFKILQKISKKQSFYFKLSSFIRIFMYITATFGIKDNFPMIIILIPFLLSFILDAYLIFQYRMCDKLYNLILKEVDDDSINDDIITSIFNKQFNFNNEIKKLISSHQFICSFLIHCMLILIITI